MLGKIASRPTTLNLTIVLLFCIQLFDRQGFNDKGTRWISSSKTKKTSLSSFLPALQGERCMRAGICYVLEREPFFECTGFSFHDFTDSLSRLAQRTGGKNDDGRKLRNDVLRYGFWIDLEQDVDHPSFATRWQ